MTELGIFLTCISVPAALAVVAAVTPLVIKLRTPKSMPLKVDTPEGR